MDEAIAVPCPACRAASEATGPGRWLCRGCGDCGFLRRCAVCGLISYVAEAQEWNQPWDCMWCREANPGFTRYCDPATATLAELAATLLAHRPAALAPPPARQAEPARQKGSATRPDAAREAGPVPGTGPAAAGSAADTGWMRPITAAKMQAIPASGADGEAPAAEPAGQRPGRPDGRTQHRGARPGIIRPPIRLAGPAPASRRRGRGRPGAWQHARPPARSARRAARAVALAALAVVLTVATAVLVARAAGAVRGGPPAGQGSAAGHASHPGPGASGTLRVTARRLPPARSWP